MSDYVVLSAEAWEALLVDLNRAPKVDNHLADALARPRAFRWIHEDDEVKDHWDVSHLRDQSGIPPMDPSL